MEPYIYTAVELQCIRGNHYKFYRGYLDHQTNEVFYQYGRIGNEGSWTDTKAHSSLADGHEAMMKQLRSKFPKGYEVVETITVTCAQKVALWQLHDEICGHQRRLQWQNGEQEGKLVIANV